MTSTDLPTLPEGIHLSFLMNLEAKFRDDENRLLGENKVPFEFHTDVPMELVECPYSGSRHKHFKPMNISALKQINNHWTKILDTFTCLRSFHISQKSLSQISLLDLYKLAIAGYLMPSYLFYRAQNPFADGELPAFVATIHKAALGLVNAVQVMLTKRLVMGRYKKDTSLDTEALYSFIEKEKLFIGPWEVCAGTPNQIKELISLLLKPQADDSIKIELIPNLKSYFHYIAQAETVVLLDNFFPIIFYFSLPNEYLTNLFEILYPKDSHSPFANELSMELQFLDLVCPLLNEKDSIQKEKVKQDLISIFQDLDSNEFENISNLFTLSKEEKEKQKNYVSSTFDFFASEDIRISKKLPRKDLEIIIYILITYILLERKKLSVYEKCQKEMNLVLDRSEISRSIDSLDVSSMYDKKLRDVLAHFLAVEIYNGREKTIIQQASNQLILE